MAKDSKRVRSWWMIDLEEGKQLEGQCAWCVAYLRACPPYYERYNVHCWTGVTVLKRDEEKCFADAGNFVSIHFKRVLESVLYELFR